MKISEANGSQASESVTSQTNQVQETEKGKKVNRKDAQKLDEVNKKTEKNGEQKEPNKEEVKDGVERLNEAVQALHEELQFELHEKSDRMMTKVINRENNEVIREIPPKELLEMLGKIKEMVGLFLDKKI